MQVKPAIITRNSIVLMYCSFVQIMSHQERLDIAACGCVTIEWVVIDLLERCEDVMRVYELAKAGDDAAIRSGEWTREQLNFRGENGRTALMDAAIRDDHRVIEALKQKGADVDLLDADGRKAVHLAALYGNSRAIAYLIEGGCGG